MTDSSSFKLSSSDAPPFLKFAVGLSVVVVVVPNRGVVLNAGFRVVLDGLLSCASSSSSPPNSSSSDGSWYEPRGRPSSLPEDFDAFSENGVVVAGVVVLNAALGVSLGLTQITFDG